ncbi:unnamed protein product [Sphagnum balticum]
MILHSALCAKATWPTEPTKHLLLGVGCPGLNQQFLVLDVDCGIDSRVEVLRLLLAEESLIPKNVEAFESLQDMCDTSPNLKLNCF